MSNIYNVGQTIAETFLLQVERRGDAPAILDEHLDVALTWSEYGAQARKVAAGLRAAGLQPGETVGLLLTNRPEFHIADAAALLAGATPFSLYQTSAPEQFTEILQNAGCRVVLTEPRFRETLRTALELGNLPVENIIDVETDSWAALLATKDGSECSTSGSEPWQPASSPADIATLIYTSGTTGAPKGVELTHQGILSMASQLAEQVGARTDMRMVSHLPMAHVSERISTHYMPMVVGHTVVCCPDATHLMPLLAAVQPEIFFSPPRVWEKLRAATAPYVSAGADPKEIRRKIGFGRIEVALTGAAPCPPSVVEYFQSLSVPLREIYGMSETAGVVAVADVGDIGRVGRPLPGTEVRVDHDGELLVRSPSMMARYRDRPEATASAIDTDGWLHTGDIGCIDDDGRIQIIDRKKELIISSSGKNMSPANIEARLRDSGPLIGHACVIGDGRPYIVALIVADPTLAATYPTAEHLNAAVQEHVELANERLARIEQIKRFILLREDWLPDSDELTPTMKFKRRAIEAKYAAQIADLYTSTSVETAPHYPLPTATAGSIRR